MINQVSEKLVKQLESRLQEVIAEKQKPIERLSASLNIIQDTIKQLKEQVNKYGFIDTSQEIVFFKKIKPLVYSYKIYELEIHQLYSKMPVGTKDDKLKYFHEELNQIQRFFNLHVFHFQYYKYNLEDFDTKYFLRHASLPISLMTELPEQESEFSTSMDYLFSKFIAYERLQQTIVNDISMLSGKAEQVVVKSDNRSLKWTGEAINLVEIAYGIWLTGQLNNGNASVTEIVSWLEDNFNVKIGRAFRRWTEISSRKRISTTKYIDSLKDSINKRIDEEYALKKNNRKAF